jgi:hypothetical protein
VAQVYLHAEGSGDAVVGGADGGLDVDPEAIAGVILGGAGGSVGVPLRKQRGLGSGRRRGRGTGAGGEPLHLGPTPPREAHWRFEGLSLLKKPTIYPRNRPGGFLPNPVDLAEKSVKNR